MLAKQTTSIPNQRIFNSNLAIQAIFNFGYLNISYNIKQYSTFFKDTFYVNCVKCLPIQMLDYSDNFAMNYVLRVNIC